MFKILLILSINLIGRIWVQTTQEDFENGKGYYIDTRTSPGDVILQKFSGINQYQLRINTFGNIYGSNWVSQTFLNTFSGYLTKIKFYTRKIGNPPNPLYVELRDCLATDLPGSNILATSQRADIGTNIAEYEFFFINPFFYASSGTKYSIVIYTNGGDASNYYALYYQNTDVYVNGRRCISSNGGTNWVGTTTDIGFKIYNSSSTLQIFQPGPSGKDAFVYQLNPNTNYGNNTTLSLERRTSRLCRTYIQFDISELGSSGNVDSSFLNLYQYRQVAANSLTIQCRRVTSSWNEGTITWNNQPSFTSTSVSSITTNSNGWKRWTATNYVRGWFDGSYPNYGFILISSPEGGTATSYIKNLYSSDYTPNFLGYGLIPYLEVFFTSYVDSGEFISASFDTDEFGETRWCRFYFNATIPLGTEIKFQIATNNDNSTWNFLGPDGTPNTYYTTSDMEIWSGHYGDRYISFKAYFKTNNSLTPVLHDVSILYFKDYYVDGINGNDLNFGSINSPLRTIARAIELMQGSDGCYVRNGTYNEDVLIQGSLSGMYNYPTFFRNFPGEEPVIDAVSYGFFDTLANFVEISGFRIINAEIGIYLFGDSVLSIYNNIINVPDGGFGIINQSGSKTSIYNNYIVSDLSATYSLEGIWVYDGEEVNVFKNEIRNMNDCGILIDNSKACKVYQNLSVGNMFGIDIISSSTCSLYNNTIDSNNDAGIHANMLTGTIYTVNNNITNNKYGFGWVDGSGYISSDYNNVWNNSNGDYLYPTGYAVSEGANDISEDPLYTPDYHLSPGSPCIDAGVYVGLPYSGLAPDIGAFESAKKGEPDKKIFSSSKGVWGDDVRLTNNILSSYLSWSNLPVMFIQDTIIGIVFYDNRDGNYEIYFLRSQDKGESWEEDKRLTFTDKPSLFPGILSSDEKLIIFWCEEGDNKIMFKRSNDLGLNWSSEIPVTTISGEINSPSFVFSGDTIHLVFYDNRTGNYEIYYKNSFDFGNTWSEDTQLTFADSGSYFPYLCKSGENLHLAWFDKRDGNYDIYYKRSTDNGITWSVDRRMTYSGSSFYPLIVSNGNDVYLFYNGKMNGKNNIYFMFSNDNGENWEEGVNLTEGFDANNPRVSINNDYLHLVYNSGYEIFYRYFNGSWGETFRVSNCEGISEYPAIVSSSDTVYIVWFDERDGNPEIYFKKNQIDTTGYWIEEPDFEFIHTELYQNIPNPFNDFTYINFTVGKDAPKNISIKIYNLSGQFVREIFIGSNKPGSYRLYFDGKDGKGQKLPSGVYFYQLESEEIKKTKKMVIIR